MILYHGSNLEIAEPRLLAQTRGLDFGAGFYLTTSKQQAEQFSEIVVKRRKGGVPTVSIYEYDAIAAESTLDIKIFPEPTAEWLEFIRDNRLKVYTGRRYDVICGPVANDRVFPTIQALIIGQFTVEAALVALKPFKLYNQYCFATESALVMLKYVKSSLVGGDACVK